MKKLLTVAAILACILAAAHMEYRYIMHHISPYTGDNGTVYIEIFGQVDVYSAAQASELDMN